MKVRDAILMLFLIALLAPMLGSGSVLERNEPKPVPRKITRAVEPSEQGRVIPEPVHEEPGPAIRYPKGAVIVDGIYLGMDETLTSQAIQETYPEPEENPYTKGVPLSPRLFFDGADRVRALEKGYQLQYRGQTFTRESTRAEVIAILGQPDKENHVEGLIFEKHNLVVHGYGGHLRYSLIPWWETKSLCDKSKVTRVWNQKWL